MNERMSPISKAVLAYVALNPKCSFEQLCVVFYPGSPSGCGSSIETFRKRINYLVSVCYLERISVNGVACFKVCPGVSPVKTSAPAPSPVPPPPPRTPPPQFDRMHGPLLTYTMAAPSRAGALDFKRLQSVGDRC